MTRFFESAKESNARTVSSRCQRSDYLHFRFLVEIESDLCVRLHLEWQNTSETHNVRGFIYIMDTVISVLFTMMVAPIGVILQTPLRHMIEGNADQYLHG